MQERQVTIAEETHKLPAPFLVIATQNPLEQEGTYPLPEAQLDRFLFKTVITYPSREEEILIMKQQTIQEIEKIEKILSGKDIVTLRNHIRENIYVDEKIDTYVRDIVFATREPAHY
jgi:MoxR-like ATPase